MKKLIITGCILLLSNQTLAAFNCKTDTVTASTPDADFVVNGDGTVTHHKTGLMWKQCSEGLTGTDCTSGSATTHTWQEALQQVKTLNDNGGFAGYADWRLPNIKELATLVEVQCVIPAINATIFPATEKSFYWSSSPVAGYASYAWPVNFEYGYDGPGSKSNGSYVRLVRGGL